jgi:ribosome-associated protein
MSKQKYIDTYARPPSDEDFVSRSAQKRDALEIERLAEGLMALKASEYAKLTLDEELKPALDLARKITSHIAKRRQMLFVAKLLRKREESLPTLYIAVDKPKSEQKKATAKMHRAERWRDRLLSDDADALQEFIAQYPMVDRQRLRSLQRAAVLGRAAVADGKPDNGSYNALYRCVMEAMEASALESNQADHVDNDDDSLQDPA